jgi:hypothetical protein
MGDLGHIKLWDVDNQRRVMVEWFKSTFRTNPAAMERVESLSIPCELIGALDGEGSPSSSCHLEPTAMQEEVMLSMLAGCSSFIRNLGHKADRWWEKKDERPVVVTFTLDCTNQKPLQMELRRLVDTPQRHYCRRSFWPEQKHKGGGDGDRGLAVSEGVEGLEGLEGLGSGVENKRLAAMG